MKNIKKIYWIKILIVFLFFCFFAPQKTEAAAWPVMDPLIKGAQEMLWSIVNNGILAVAKQEAVKEINNQLNNLMGTDGEGSFVNNWRAELIGKPKNNASLFLNSYLTRSAEGKNTQSGYEGVCGTNYVAAMTETSKTRIEESQSVRKFSYDGDPTKMFQGDSFKPMENYIENNPYSHRLFTEAAYQKRLEEEEKIAQAKKIANQGFNDTEDENGNVISPGILKKDSMAKANAMPLESIPSAKSIGELLTAMATTALSQQFKQGYINKRKEYDSDWEYSDKSTNGAIDVNSSYDEYQRQTEMEELNETQAP